MRILFVHNNFPAQYRPLALKLAADTDNELVAIGSQTARQVPGVRLLRYPSIEGRMDGVHPFARRFETESRRCEQVIYCLTSLRSSGFEPDVILAHPGWGETMPLRAFFPRARIILYCEFFYGMEGRDVGFDPEFAELGIDFQVSLHLKNAATLLALPECTVGVAPTAWQRSTYPTEFRDKISICHEGIDVGRIRPDPDAALVINENLRLSRDDEVVTFVARNLEPLRGYHAFMRALPEILDSRPQAHVVIVGGDSVSYGPSPPGGMTWRSIFFKEVERDIDTRRVHFLGALPYATYLKVLQISSAHVYLTYPFVLSWSLIEALGAGCLVIGSDTAPVREVIDDRNGVLVPFFDRSALATAVIDALAEPEKYEEHRRAARMTAVERFDLNRICLPKMMDILKPNSSILKTIRRFPSRSEIASMAMQ